MNSEQRKIAAQESRLIGSVCIGLFVGSLVVAAITNSDLYSMVTVLALLLSLAMFGAAKYIQAGG